MTQSRFIRYATTAAYFVAVVFATAVWAEPQRLSLSERVAKLEQQLGEGSAQGNIELVNQINALQAQLQSLQGQIEELKHQVDESKLRNKEQYIDLDSRIARLEGRGSASAPAGGQLQDIPLAAPAEESPSGTNDEPASSSAIHRVPATPAAPVSPPRPPPVASSTGTTDLGKSPDPAAEKSAYDQAFNALKDGRYADSARRFQSFIDQYPNGELAGNAYYWLGESYYVTQNYRISLETFQKLLKQFPASPKAGDALLKVGYCHYEMKEWAQAEATLNEVVQKYPDTTVARLAQGRLRALKLEGHH